MRRVSYEASGGLNAVDQAIVRNNTIQINGDADNPNRISNVIPTAITCNSCAEFTIENNIFGGNVNVIHLVNARRGPWGTSTVSSSATP